MSSLTPRKYTLKPGARERLAKVAGILLAYPGLRVQVEGHTDSVGGDEFNQRLSENRAGAVRDYLTQQGVSRDAISSQGFGKTQPVASNDTALDGSRTAGWIWWFPVRPSEPDR